MNKLLINSICAAAVSSSSDATKIAEASQLDFTGRLVIGIVLVLLAASCTIGGSGYFCNLYILYRFPPSIRRTQGSLYSVWHMLCYW